MATNAEDFRFRHPVAVRFRDIDIGGHAHHSEALMYFEEARWAYWGEVVGGRDPSAVNYVLGEARIRWHKRVFWPQTLSVGVRVDRIGRKHFAMSYEVSSGEGEVLVSGETVQVMYDYEAQKSVQMPADLRRTLEEYEGLDA